MNRRTRRARRHRRTELRAHLQPNIDPATLSLEQRFLYQHASRARLVRASRQQIARELSLPSYVAIRAKVDHSMQEDMAASEARFAASSAYNQVIDEVKSEPAPPPAAEEAAPSGVELFKRVFRRGLGG